MKLKDASDSHVNQSTHDFLKANLGIRKYAKETKPHSNVKQYNKLMGLKESHGSSWVRDRLLGHGCSGFVFLAKNTAPTNLDSDLPAEIAVKSIFMELSSSLQHEKEILCNLAPCTDIVRCYGDEITTIQSGEEVYDILLEYCPGSSLKNHIFKFGPNGLPESEVRRYTRDIVRGLCYIHCNARYIHCDIKPDNTLLSSPSSCEANKGCLVAKTVDFGSAKWLISDVLSEDFRGSRLYMSPELAKDGYLDWPADIWALGCVVLEMLTGRQAPNFRDNLCFKDELQKISNEISRAGRDFIKKCLVTSPYKRRPAWLLTKHRFVSF